MGKKWDYRDVKMFVEVETGCKLLSEEYKDSRSKMLFSCPCGQEFETTFDAFKSKHVRICGECRKKRYNEKRAHGIDYVKEYAIAKGCKLLTTSYENQDQKLTFKCSCDNIFATTFAKFKNRNKTTCNDCSNKKVATVQMKEVEIFGVQVFETVGTEYVFLEEYKGARKKIRVKHNLCNHIYSITPDSFLNKKRRCPKCSGGIKKGHSLFVNDVNQKYKGEYQVIGEYIGARKAVKIKHSSCGYEFEVQASNFIRGLSACHKCNGSFGERKIIEFLEVNHIKYKTEYTFEGLRGKRNRPFPFDFVIFDDNKPKLAIEYDGIQHFKPVEYFGGVESLKKVQERDKRKNRFCEENNIKLIRIPYWQFDEIEEILKDVI